MLTDKNSIREDVEEFDLFIPNSIIAESVADQISDRHSNISNKNFLKIFEIKKDSQVNDEAADGTFEYDDDGRDQWNEAAYQFYANVEKQFKDFIGVTVTSSGNDMYKENIHAIYNVLVLYMDNNMVAFLTSYIMHNKLKLAQDYETRCSQITLRNAKKRYKLKTDATIAASGPNIIEDTLSNETIDPDVFIESLLRYNPGDVAYSMLYSLITNNAITINSEKFTEYIRVNYLDNMYNFNKIKNFTLERLMNTFPIKLNEEGDTNE